MDQGMLLPLVAAVKERGLKVCNIVVRQDGRVAAAYDFTPPQRRLLYSASKTFTSMGVGLAVGEGRLGLEDRVLDFFPGYTPASAQMSTITVRDLLRMASGHDTCPLAAASPEQAEDIAGCFFSRPLKYAPGNRFVYNNAGTYLLSNVIGQTTGESLKSYLAPRVFAPLGIENPRWDCDKNGVSNGYSGLYLNADELARFGQLILDDGEWGGKQLLPGEYVRAAKSFQIATDGITDEWATADSRQGYGYQLWLNSYPGSCRMDGYRGQYCVMLPDKRAVVTYLSDEPVHMLAILSLTWEFLTDRL